MLSSIHKAILATFAIVMLVLLLPVTQANAEQILVCKASENFFDALDNNCDGDVDDTEELDNLGLITGKDWYKTSIVSVLPDDLCTEASGETQCFSSRDIGTCTHSESGGYYCDVSLKGSGSGSSPSGSSPDSGSTSSQSPSSTTPASFSSPTGASTGGGNTPSSSDPDENKDNDICTYFQGVEKCLTDADNGNDCVDASNGLFYCSAVPNQKVADNICVATIEIYNGIDDDCDEVIDEDVEPPQTLAVLAEQQITPTVVSAPATLFIFSLGILALAYTRRKS